MVAGIRTPQPLTRAMAEAGGSEAEAHAIEEVHAAGLPRAVRGAARRLEAHYRDMQDIEFTVQQGRLFMLQTRSGKRTAAAALKVAVDMAREGLIDEDEAVLRIEPASLDQLLHPTLDPKAERKIVTKALPASPGAASGKVVFSADEAERAGQGRRGGDPGPDRDLAGGHPRHARGRGHPDRARRHDEPRRGGGARHGQGLRLRAPATSRIAYAEPAPSPAAARSSARAR